MTDNSGKMFIHYWIAYSSSKDSLIIGSTGLFNKDSLLAQFTAASVKIKSVEVFNADSTTHAQIEFQFDSIDSLNTLKSFTGAKFTLEDAPGKTKKFSQIIPPFMTGYGLNNKSTVIEYVYYLPGKIFNHNAQELYRNRLTWRFNSDEIGPGQLLYATYVPFKLKETPRWIYYLGAVVIFVVIIFLLKRR